MKSPKIRIQLAVLAFIMLPAVTGIVAVNASATCERFVRNYITKPVRNRVSNTTAEAWAAWRLAHPNWKPNPALHRPKYVMNREETVQKVDFACSVPLIPTATNGLLEEADVPPVIDFTPMSATQITFPEVVPPEVAELTPEEWPPLGPYLPPIFGSGGIYTGGVPNFPIVPPTNVPVSGGAVPEPASLFLATTGIGFIGILLAARKRKLSQAAL